MSSERTMAMGRPVRLSRVFGVWLLGGVSVLPVNLEGAPARADQSGSGVGPAAAAPGQEKAVVQETLPPEERDRRYREMLRTAEGLLAVWRQQPENQAALKRSLAELQSKLEAVRAAAGPAPAAARETSKPPPTATARGASGPVKSSSRPSPPDEVQRRIKATERFLPAGPRPAGPSLAGVSPESIRAACDMAQSQIVRLGKLLQSVPFDRPAIDRGLRELNESLHHLNGPVEIPEPTTPRPGPATRPRG